MGDCPVQPSISSSHGRPKETSDVSSTGAIEKMQFTSAATSLLPHGHTLSSYRISWEVTKSHEKIA